MSVFTDIFLLQIFTILLRKMSFCDIKYTRVFISRYGGKRMSTNLSKIKRDKMLDTISKIKENVNDEETLKNLSLIEYELTKKKYGLVWEEHEEKVDEELKNQIPTFEEVKDKEIVSNKEDKFNFLLEGDNLHSLYLLEKTHKGNIDFIYIDPPYNTENKEFIYNDSRVGTDDTYRHSKWLSFMEKRLRIAKKLLSNKGCIFISIDQNEFAQLKLLCDDIFGENNFIGTLIWRKKYGGGQTDEFFVTEHEYIFGYRKTSEFKWFDKNLEVDESNFKYKDNKGSYSITKLEKWGSSAHREDRPTMYFSIIDPDGNEIYPIAPDGKDGRWRVGKGRLEDLINNNGIHWVKDNKNNRWIPYEKNYFENAKGKLLKSRSIIYDLAETGTATKLLTNIFEEKDIFQNPKPIELIQFLLEHTESNIVLDFFAGSGSTGHAVLEQNKIDNISRNYILCTNNENNICENITYKRLYNINYGTPKIEPLKHNLKYYKTTYIPRLSTDEENIQENLLLNIKNLIQLENGISIDNEKIKVILDEEEIDTFSLNVEEVKKCEKLYISTDILLTAQQVKTFKDNNVEVYVIPEYYFENEIREVQ